MQRQHLRDRSDIKQIEREILQGTPVNQIAVKYDITPTSLYKYKAKHLTNKYNKAKDKRDLREGSNILDYMENIIGSVDRLFRACEKALEDPEDPEQLFLGNNALDTIITYLEPDKDGVDRKHKASIQDLLDTLNKVTVRVEVKGPDRATTLLQAAQTLTKQVHLLGELSGRLGNTTINVTNQPVFIELTQVVMTALQPYPDALQAVAQHLRGLKLKDTTVKSNSILDITPKTEPPDTTQESTERTIPINRQNNP